MAVSSCPFPSAVCSYLICGFSLPRWYLVAIVLSVLIWFAASHYLVGILWPLWCLFLFDLRLLITPLVSCGHCDVCSYLICGFLLPRWYLVAIVLSVLIRFTASHYPVGILCPLCCLFLFDLRLLITPLVSCRHCVVCSYLICGFLLPHWYLVAIVLSVLIWFTASHYPIGILCPLCCLFLFDLRIISTSLVSSNSFFIRIYRFHSLI
jgi:hypothetical protein